MRSLAEKLPSWRKSTSKVGRISLWRSVLRFSPPPNSLSSRSMPIFSRSRSAWLCLFSVWLGISTLLVGIVFRVHPLARLRLPRFSSVFGAVPRPKEHKSLSVSYSSVPFLSVFIKKGTKTVFLFDVSEKFFR
jgi:hypothetical protein